MEIDVRCPHCETEYHLDPSLIGQRIRCPNSHCRAVFEVRPSNEGAAAEQSGTPLNQDAPADSTSGTVGEIVPLLPAQPANEPPSERPKRESVPADDDLRQAPLPPVPMVGQTSQAKAVPEWVSAPPPVRQPKQTGDKAPQPSAKVQPKQQASAPSPTVDDRGPIRPEHSWQAAPPPVRQQPAASAFTPASTPFEGGFPWEQPAAQTKDRVSDGDSDHHVEQPAGSRGRRARQVTVALIAVLAIGIGTIAWTALGIVEGEEHRIYAEAYRDFKENRFAAAALQFRRLAQRFPESDKVGTYQFLADLSDLFDHIHQIQANPVEGLEGLRSFERVHQGSDLLTTNGKKLAAAYLKLAEDLAAAARQRHQPELLDLAELAAARVRQYDKSQHEKLKIISKRISEVRNEVARVVRRQQLVRDLKRFLIQPAPTMIQDASRTVSLAAAEYRDLADDPEIRALLRDIHASRRRLVRWHANEKQQSLPTWQLSGILAAGPRVFAAIPWIVVAPPTWESVLTRTEPQFSLLVAPPLQAAVDPPVGRTGVVFASARGVLYALEKTTGNVLWTTRHGIDIHELPLRLPASEATPELVLVPDTDTFSLTARRVSDGAVFWRAKLSGPCLGRSLLVRNLAYVATTDGKIHVIEPATGRRLGWYDIGESLASGATFQPQTGVLFFPTETGELYAIDPAQKKCIAVIRCSDDERKLRGAPVVISRAGQRQRLRLAADEWPDLLVISQVEGLDKSSLAVFSLPLAGELAEPLLRTRSVNGWPWFSPFVDGEQFVQMTDAGVLSIFGIQQPRNKDKELFLQIEKTFSSGQQRSQVAHVVEDDLWLLDDGRLRLLHHDRYYQRLVESWSVEVGQPLHEAYVDIGEEVLYLATRLNSTGIHQALAVDIRSVKQPRILWRRQLGLHLLGEPLFLDGRILAAESNSALHLFDAKRKPYRKLLAGPLAEPLEDCRLVKGPGETAAVIYTTPSKLHVRHVQGEKVSQFSSKVPPLAGQPALHEANLLLPLRDGKLFLLSMKDGKSFEGPSWRAPAESDDAAGHAVALSATDWLITDGDRSLLRLRWPGGIEWQEMARGTLPARIASAPLVLKDHAETVSVCVLDAANHLWLLQEAGDARPHSWKRIHRWQLPGKATAGPLKLGPYIGCIVDRCQLVCFVESSSKEVWTYQRKSDAIVGRPLPIDDAFVIAHQSGLLVAIDLRTGQPLGSGYRLRKDVAPLATPLPFGENQLFVPLSDGTVLLLPLARLK
ncbi:MAG: hypothetical protein KatS3mg105_4817 [Gemmatales bacterium]|nr:MAG: hypothetical protein KatS3mg105_4817 [Gemmatales bacterium]